MGGWPVISLLKQGICLLPGPDPKKTSVAALGWPSTESLLWAVGLAVYLDDRAVAGQLINYRHSLI
jgi:hypothetical protein